MKNISRWLGGRGGSKGFVMVGASVSVLFLVGALLAGAQSRGGLIDLLSGRFWLTNDSTGSVMLANGSSAKVDFRMTIDGAHGHSLEVVRVGSQSLLVDRKSGAVSRLDLANLTVANSQSLPNAGNVSLLAVGDKLVVVDPNGNVEVQDPATLRTLSTLPLGQRLTRGVVSPDGTVWVGEPSAGVVVPLTITADGQLRSGKPVTVGIDDQMELSLVNDKPTVVAVGKRAIITIDGSAPSAAVPFPLSSGDTLAVPAKVVGPLFPISINKTGQVVLVNGNVVRPVDLGLQGRELGGPVPFNGRVYVPDYTDGQLVVIDASGNHANAPGVDIPANTRFSVTLDGGRLWVDSPNGTVAFVLGQGEAQFRAIDKVDIPKPVTTTVPTPVSTTVPTSSIPPTTVRLSGTTTTLPHVQVTTIPPSAPGAPTNVGAVGGNATATVSWGPATPNGAAIQEYDVSWSVSGLGGKLGQTIVPAGSPQTIVSSLANGTTYTFTVAAKNNVGVGPGAVSPPVTPSSNVPLPPAPATATANSDGSIDVVWQAADGQGHPIQGYDITGSPGPAGGPPPVKVASKGSGTTAHIPATAGFVLGVLYNFTLTAINDVNNASTPSQPSNAVTPYMPALAPGAPTAKVNGTSLDVSWVQPDLKGGTFNSYIVTGSNALPTQSVTSGASVTSATFSTGLIPGTSYTFTILTTTKANGQSVTGAKASTPSTPFGIAPSASNLSASLSGDRQVSVSFNVDGHNSGGITCHVNFNGTEKWQGGCGNPAAPIIGGLAYSTTYDIYATADNSFGSGQTPTHASVRTNDPPPSPSVTVSKGAAGRSNTGSCQSLANGCHWVHVALRNFSANTRVRIGCSDFGGEFWTYNVTTNSGGSSDSEVGGCLYGNNRVTLTVTANGVSGSIVW